MAFEEKEESKKNKDADFSVYSPHRHFRFYFYMKILLGLVGLIITILKKRNITLETTIHSTTLYYIIRGFLSFEEEKCQHSAYHAPNC